MNIVLNARANFLYNHAITDKIGYRAKLSLLEKAAALHMRALNFCPNAFSANLDLAETLHTKLMLKLEESKGHGENTINSADEDYRRAERSFKHIHPELMTGLDDSDVAYWRFCFGKFLQNAGKIDRAEHQLLNAIELRPSIYRYWFGYAELLARQFDETKDPHKQDELARQMRWCILRGRAVELLKQGRTRETLQVPQQCYSVDASMSIAHFFRNQGLYPHHTHLCFLSFYSRRMICDVMMKTSDSRARFRIVHLLSTPLLRHLSLVL